MDTNFAKAFRNRYPEKHLIMGKFGSEDQYGTPYLSIAIGGIKHEGSAYIAKVQLPPEDSKLEDLWWQSFEEILKDNNVVVCRTEPEAVSWEEKVINDFEDRIERKQYSQIRGRFSFYKEFPNAN